jgi:predicted Zn-dependent peptidase
VREKRGLVYSIYAFHSAYQDGGLFGIYAGTGEEETAELLPVICEQLAEVAESADQDELERARAQLRSSLLMALESSSQRCEGLAKQLLTRDRVLTPEEMLGKLEAVQLADIKALAARLSGAEPTLAGIGPLSKLESFDSLRARLVA